MAVNTTEPKIRDAYGSLIDNPNYIRPIVAGVNDRVGLPQDPVLKNTYNAGVNAYGERLDNYTPSMAYKDISLSPNTESPELVAAREAKAGMDRTAGYQTVDEATIRKEALANFQAEIDATNALYANKLARAKVEGANRLGQSGAIQARRGLLGSTFGEAQTNVVSGANEEVYGSIENERNSRVLALQDKAREYADTNLEAKRKAKIEGLDSYIKYLSEEGARKTTNAQKVAAELLAAQIAPEQVNPDVLQDTAKNYGVTTDAIKAAYTQLKKTKEDADKAAALKDAYSLKPGETRYDATGKVLSALPVTPKTPEEIAMDKAELAYKNSQTAVNLANVQKAQKELADSKKTATSASEQVNHLQFLRETVADAKKIASAAGQSLISRGIGNTLIGDTNYNQLGQYADTLRTNLLTLATDPDIKKFFGPQMSNADVRMMQSAATIMSNETQPEVLKRELDRIDELFTRLQNGIAPADVSSISDAELERIANGGK